MPRVYGILAYPAKHSLSPVIFKALFKALKINATYKVFEVEPANFNAFVRKIREGEVKCEGLSVSSPYKEKILPFLDFIDEHVKRIGACNTVVVRRGRLHGFNTDFIGAVEALKGKSGAGLRDTGLRGKKVVVLGAGGAARAIVYGLVRQGAKVAVLNRTVEKAKKVARKFGVDYGSLDSLRETGRYWWSGGKCDILVQATSVWLDEGSVTERINGIREASVADSVKRGMIVMDIVYKPLITPLLREAKKRGCKIITGEKMLFYQALEQFEIWSGRRKSRQYIQRQ